MFIMHLYKSIDEIHKRDEQILGGIFPPLTGSESWFDKFFSHQFLLAIIFHFITDCKQIYQGTFG